MALLSVRNLTKSYAGVTVLDGVSLELAGGEIHALVGENGAGKSTLCRMLAGVVPPTSGEMRLDGKIYSPRSRRQAESAGIRMVLQELNLLPTLTVAENIYVDAMPHRLGLIDYRRMNADAARAVESLGLRNIRPDQALSSLGIGQAQLVEIAAALAKNCRLLILDEPTAALTTPEIELLFNQLRRLKREGTSILYVSHRMEEIRAISDRITVLRDGRHVATRLTSELSHDETVRLMVGRDLSSQNTRVDAPGSLARSAAVPVLSVQNLTRAPAIKDISLDLHKGEILGIAGLMGSGRTELLRAIFAADLPDSGEILLDGAAVRFRSPRDAVRRGIAFLTEDRKSQGLLLPCSIQTNTTLPNMPAVSLLRSWINVVSERATAEKYISSLSTRCRSARQLVRELSGGNQQKVVLAKWLFRDPAILLFDEPTRGIDVGAKFEIYALLRSLAGAGKSLLVVSSDLQELTAIADRIAVMSAGRIVRTFDRGEWTQESIMEAALSGYSGSAKQEGTAA